MISIKRLTRFKLTTGLILISIGLILGGLTLFNTWRSQHSAAASSESIKSTDVKDNDLPALSGKPTHITIPSVNIDLKVVPGYYYATSKSWSLSLNDAQYGVMTAPANNKQGMTFIYAHYRKGVFLNLPKIQPGAQVIITTDNGHTFTYSFARSIVTSPSDTSLFKYHGKPLLVLQTCTGLWYQDRQLFLLDLVKAS
jgi:LPXTG-site transpeptidase (sortase) family protein